MKNILRKIYKVINDPSLLIIRLESFFTYCVIKLRTIFWRYFFGSLKKNSQVLGRIKVYSPQNVYIGENTSINDSVILNARTRLCVGNYCHISPGVIINTGGLDISVNYKKRPHIEAEVHIKDGVWLCSGVIINPGVTIGEGAVVASGAVVNHDVEPFTLVGGVPARVIRKIS